MYPQTKTYFSHWPDLAVGSTSVNNHGSKVISGVALAVKCIDDLATGLLDLSEQHAYSMRVDPANFKVRNNLGTVVPRFTSERFPDKLSNRTPLSSSDPVSLHSGGGLHHVPQGLLPRGSRRLRQIPVRCQPVSVREVPLSCAAAVRGTRQTLMVQNKNNKLHAAPNLTLCLDFLVSP